MRFFKVVIRKGFKIFAFRSVPFFFYSLRKTLIKTILKASKKEYTDYFINYNCSGETYLFLALLKNLPLGKNPCFVATKKYHVQLCEFMFPEIDVLFLPEILNFRAFYNSCFIEIFDNKKFYHVLPFKHFVELENDIQNGKNIHFFDAIKKTMQINNKSNLLLVRPIIYEHIKKSVFEKAKAISLNVNNFVFLCPESMSNKNCKNEFWGKIVERLNKLGYDVFSNIIFPSENYPTTKQCFLNFQESYYLASMARGIIGLRSGIMDIFSSISEIPLICIYTDFKNRGELKQMADEKVLESFSLKKLPFANSKNIYEYKESEVDDSKIVNGLLYKMRVMGGGRIYLWFSIRKRFLVRCFNNSERLNG